MFNEQYPELAEWIGTRGWIEIGTDENSDSLVRVLDEGGQVWESPSSIADLNEALAEAERFVGKYIAEDG